MMLHWASYQKRKGVWWWRAQNKTKKYQKEENKQSCLWTTFCKTPQKSPCQKLCSDWSSHSLLLAARPPQGFHSWAATAWPWSLSQGCSVTLLTPTAGSKVLPSPSLYKRWSTVTQQHNRLQDILLTSLWKQVWNSAIIVCCASWCSFPLSL